MKQEYVLPDYRYFYFVKGVDENEFEDKVWFTIENVIEGTEHNNFIVYKNEDDWHLCLPNSYIPLYRFKNRNHAIRVAKQLDLELLDYHFEENDENKGRAKIVGLTFEKMKAIVENEQ